MTPVLLKNFSKERLLAAHSAASLDMAYQAIREHPAWLDFQGRLQGLKEEIEVKILRGDTAPGGSDVTPAMRAAYGVLLEVIAWPEYVARRRRTLESEIFGKGIMGDTQIEELQEINPFE